MRDGKVWCLRVYFHFVLSYSDAENYCWNNFHSTLSGPADETEYNHLLDQTKNDPTIVTSLLNGKYVSVMMVLGSQRTPQCYNNTRSAPCKKPNGYHWMDNATTSNYMIENKWNPDRPPYSEPDQPEGCVGVRVYVDPTRRSDELLWSLSCNDAMSAFQVVLKLVVCGHPGVCPGESTSTKLTTPVPSTTTITTETPTVPTTTAVSTTTAKVCDYSQLECEPGWTPFNRTIERPYCFKIVDQYNQTYNQSVALCNAHGGFLSGVENITEYNFVVQLAKNIVNYTSSTNGQVLITIALKRKVVCLTTGSTESCTTFKAYEFEDGYNTNYVAIIQHYNLWASGQPVIISSQPHGCVGIMVTDPINGNDGKLFATQCETGTQTYGMSNYALCARLPDVCPP